MIRACPLFLAGLALFLAAALSVHAQQSSTPSLNDAQKEGRRIFEQRCAVCHTPPTVVSKRYGPALYKELVQDNEDNIRDTIIEGREILMPGFKYGLTRAEVDSIIEYLKTVSRPARPKPNPNQKDSGAVMISKRMRVIARIAAVSAGFALLVFAVTAMSAPAQQGGVLLSGSVKSDTGARLDGVTVSARAIGATISTSVFTFAQA